MTTVMELLVVAGRSRTWVGRPQAFSRWPILIHTYHAAPLPCCALEKSLGRSTAWAWHGMCESNTAALCKGKTQSKPLATRHGSGAAWALPGHGILCELAFTH